jgi:phasin family protein
MKLLRRTNAPQIQRTASAHTMIPTQNPLSDIGRDALESARKAARISMDSAERTLNVQLEYAKGAMTQAAINARAASQAKDVQELFALRSRVAENAMENLMGYSRSLYEVVSEAQSEYSRLAEERMSKFQATVSDTVDQAAKSAPAGSDVAVAAIRSQLAAATAAFDSFSKAAKHVASFADAGITSASRPAKSRK